MSSIPIRHSGPATLPEPSSAKKPAASVKEVPRGDFVSIHSRAVLLDKLEEIANLANEATGADGVAVALREGDQFLCRASLGFAPEPGVAVYPGEGVCGQCLAESRLVLSQDLPGEVKSALAAPIVVDGKIQGLIATFSFRAGAFAASHSDLLVCLASDIAQGLDSIESIHLVSREATGNTPVVPMPDALPSSREQRLAVIEAVTSPALPSSTPAAEVISAMGAIAESVSSEQTPQAVNFLGYNDAAEAAVFESEENAISRRPFRNHWDIVVILAAILIAVLTFGIWLHHRRSEPYTGQLTDQPGSTLSLNSDSSVGFNS
jgi:GAF domain-containing protein